MLVERPDGSKQFARFVNEQTIRHFKARMAIFRLADEKHAVTGYGPSVTYSERCRLLAKLAKIRRVKAIIRSPFSWAPRLVIWIAYLLTTPLKNDVIYDDGEYSHPTDPLLRRAGL